MEHKGYTITAEVEAYEQWTIDETGKAIEFIADSSNGFDVTGYFFANEATGDDFFETSSTMDFAMLKDVIDDHVAELTQAVA